MQKVLLYADAKDVGFNSYAKNCLDHARVFLPSKFADSLLKLVMECRANDIEYVVTCSEKLLQLLLKSLGKESKGSCQQWAGACLTSNGIKFIITRSFKQIATTTTGRFIFTRHVYKHIMPYWTIPEMSYDIIDGISPRGKDALDLMSQDNVVLVAIDIETRQVSSSEERVAEVCKRQGISPNGIGTVMKKQTGSKRHFGVPVMDMCGYCVIWRNSDGTLSSKSFVLNINSMEDIYLMRKLNSTKAPKICQNGGYESTWFIRYNSPMYNWIGDTFHFMHSWYSELPRTLDFISSMFLPNYEYWKDQVEVSREWYNAIDTYSTAWIWVFMMLEAPEWAKENYLIEFRKCFPNIQMGFEGFKVDPAERDRLMSEYMTIYNESYDRLQKIVYEGFNPNSPKQVLAVMNAMARPRSFKSSDDKNLEKFSEVGPIAAIIVELIQETRRTKKAVSTFIDATNFCGRLLYEINAGGTSTGRSSSKASNLWVGTQIQNQDTKLRSMYIADTGYLLCSVDGSQAESRTTAYLSQDLNLIGSVETAPDFHKRNASLFFGIPENEITKAIRTLSKRVNHGANYNMGAFVLIQTMGTANVRQAATILDLPIGWGLGQIADFLLSTFEKAYPDVKGRYYDEIIAEIRSTKLLRLPNGWTRRCFGTPSRRREDKKHLNEYAAHPSQSLSVMLVDEAIFDFWLEYQIKQEKARLKAQVHDEGVFQSLPEHMPECMAAFSELMARPLEVKGRTMIIPNDGGATGIRWSEIK